MAHHIVLIDDEPEEIALLTSILERTRDFSTESYTSPVAGLEAVLASAPDAVICDWMMVPMDGLDVTRQIRRDLPALPILMLTGRDETGMADRAFEAGATDFITKPTEPRVLLARLRNALEKAPGQSLLLDTVRKQFDPQGIVGSSPPVERVRAFVKGVAAVARAPALLLGESGTGKNLVARAIHAASDASSYRFVEVNCAALPANLLEAELFGYEKGAFTDAGRAKKGLVEEADGGTLFLDEIGSMPLELQAKLLTFLESRTYRRLGSTRDQSVELRILAATNAELEDEVREGRFREDLFYRLNVARVTLPPLREIKDDIPALARHFAERAAEYFRKPLPPIDEEELLSLRSYDWPGNARELRNAVERALIFSGSEALRLTPPVRSPHAAPSAPTEGIVFPPGLTLEEVERRYIEATMAEVGGSVTDAAERLGVTRKVLWSRRKKHGLLDGG